MDAKFLNRNASEGFSGGEKKRNEIFQLAGSKDLFHSKKNLGFPAKAMFKGLVLSCSGAGDGKDGESKRREPSISTILTGFGNSFDPYGALSTPFYQTSTFNQVNMCDLSEVASAIGPRTRLVWLEIPTNPRQQIIDIRKVAELAHSQLWWIIA